MSGVLASANLFQLLGVSPVVGRAMTPAEEAAREPVAVISYDLWQRRFGGDSAVTGKTMALVETGKGGLPLMHIIGVMPPWFAFPDKRGAVLGARDAVLAMGARTR